MAVKKNVDLTGLGAGTGKYAKEMVGKKYGRLTIIMHVGDRVLKCGQRQSIVIAQCDCRNINTYIANHVKTGWTKSCGCLQSEETAKNHTIHGHKPKSLSRGTKEYSIWQSIKWRCKRVTSYLELGITVCPEWYNSYETFINDMGMKPSPEYTLERKDNTKGYYRENCVWATRLEQANNTRRNKHILVNGEKLTYAQAMRKYTFGRSRLRTMMKQPDKNHIL